MISIHLDASIVLLQLETGLLEAVSQASDGLAEGLSADEHVSSLCNLHLISVLTEEGTLGVEVVDSHLKLWYCGVRRRCRVSCAEVVMIGVNIVVILVQFLVLADNSFNLSLCLSLNLCLGLSLSFGLGGDSDGSEKSECEKLHFCSSDYEKGPKMS